MGKKRPGEMTKTKHRLYFLKKKKNKPATRRGMIKKQQQKKNVRVCFSFFRLVLHEKQEQQSPMSWSHCCCQ